MVVALVAAAVLPTLTAGCGGQTTGGGSDGTGGVATYAFEYAPTATWDPAVESGVGSMVLMNCYETLTLYDPQKGITTPVLATQWSASKDGLTWTFKIREGVKFHDGTVVDAEAVKYSIDRTMKMNTGLSYIWAGVKSIEVPEKYTVVFHLDYPKPMDLVASSSLGAFILSPAAVESHPKGWIDSHEVGSGPYVLQTWKAGQTAVLDRFNEYWRGWDGKHLDKVVVTTVPETATRRQMLEAGTIDVTTDLSAQDYEALQGNPKLQLTKTPSYKNLFIYLNTKKSPLDDVRVRKALAYAFPYDQAIAIALGGYAVQSRGVVPVGMWGYNEKGFQYTDDLAKAKQLLSEAGYGSGGLDILAVWLSGEEAERKALEVYKAELKKLGVNLTVRGEPWTSQWERAKSENPPQDMLIFWWWPTYADPYDWLYNLLHSQKPPLYNLSYWDNQEFDKLIDKAASISATDRAAAAKMYVQAQDMVARDAPLISILDAQSVFASSASFKGLRPNPAYQNVVFFYDCYRQ